VKFVIDENVPFPVVRALRAAGHDCVAIAESSSQAPDDDVLATARECEAIPVTLDSDYGRLLFHEGHAPPQGVVYMRARPDQLNTVAMRFVELFAEGLIDPVGRYVVIDMADVRSLVLKAE
jgi:predicted nuclease of predicted toxin-antitoxin system